MVTLIERHLMTLAVFLNYVSAPGSALSATTILDSGKSIALAKVSQLNPDATIDSEEGVIDHAAPGSQSVSASGSETAWPSTFSSTNGTVTAGLDQYVFSLHWSGAAHMTVTNFSIPYAQARSVLCGGQAFSMTPCASLVFQVSSPTPITISASGTAVSTGVGRSASSNYILVGVVVDTVEVINAGTESFERRFSAILSPGTYEFKYLGAAYAEENPPDDAVASASLDIVMTLSPVGDCSDGLDNDGDTLVDLDDPDCADGTDTSEAFSAPVPALGTAGRAVALTALLLLTLYHLRTRRRV